MNILFSFTLSEDVDAVVIPLNDSILMMIMKSVIIILVPKITVSAMIDFIHILEDSTTNQAIEPKEESFIKSIVSIGECFFFLKCHGKVPQRIYF